MKKRWLKIFLAPMDSQGGENPDASNLGDQGEENQEEVKTYTQEEVDELTKGLFSQEKVDEIVEKRLARYKEKVVADAKKKEAERMEEERLSKLSAEGRAEEEAKKKDEEIARLKAEINRNNLEKDTIDRLNEEGLPLSFKSFLMGPDAETTNQAIKDFKGAYNLAVQEEVERRLKGKTPNGQGDQLRTDPWSIVSSKYKK